MAKYYAAVMKHSNGTVVVLKCDGQDDKQTGQRYGRIVQRTIAKHYGDALRIANEIEGKIRAP